MKFDYDIAIVGAGFAGLYMLYKARELGLSARVFEAGDDVGGTWYWNCYPGARCDVESMQYSYQFSDQLQEEWEWTEKYATQPEILRYIQHVAERFDLRRDIEFGTRIVAAHFDEGTSGWRVAKAGGETITAHFCVMAAGCLSETNSPPFPGSEAYTGKIYHTGRWPKEGVDFKGKRVAVIGTGSSGIQCIPLIAEEAEHLTVFQRTPNYAVPAWNEPLASDTVAETKAAYAELRARSKTRPTGYWFPFNSGSALDAPENERRAVYEEFWRHGGLKFLGAYGDLFSNADSNETIGQFAREKIRAKIEDPALADKLIPNTTIGSKRICVETNYYETFNRDNVALVDVNERPIERFTEAGLRVGGDDCQFDAVVLATGFDAMTGALLAMDIRGESGRALAEKWAGGPRTYLGLAIAGFPNMFIVNGPGSPSVLSNMVQSIECNVDWIADCLRHLNARDLGYIAATEEAEDGWVTHNNEVVSRTLRAKENSWYVGANIPGRPRVFMPYAGGVPAYLKKCADVVANGYEGFTTA